MELNDVGQITKVDFYIYDGYYSDVPVQIIMGVKAPRGQMFIFGDKINDQCRAIKAFMKEHRND